MIYIETKNEIIVYEHYMPFDPKYGLGKSEEELKETGYLVESIPEYSGEIPDGEYPELHYDGTDFSWVMVDKPTPSVPDEYLRRIEELEAKIAELEANQNALAGI